MNIEYAQTIAVSKILDKIGSARIKANHIGYLYQSPFDNHKKHCLQVNEGGNRWYDHKLQAGGQSLELVMRWLKWHGKQCRQQDALHWLKFNIGYPSLQSFMKPAEPEPDNQYKLVHKTRLQEGGLLRYASSRGITPPVAKHLFKQVYLINKRTGREFVAIGFKNESNGWTIYNPKTEAMILPIDVRVILGARAGAETIHVFKDVFDYWKALASRQYEAFDGDCIILNSYACIDKASPYIRGNTYIRRLYTWFNNDSRGRQATQAFAWLCSTEQDLEHESRQLPE